jgi:tetratricopeptide (TPR) repeat protein
MAFIGRILVNLNILAWAPRPILATILIGGITAGNIDRAWSLDRVLRPDEVATLEANLKADAKNATSRRFLFDNYIVEKQWAQAVAIGQPAQQDLSQSQLLKLADAFLNLQDGNGLLGMLAYYHGKYAATAHTRYLEGMGQFFAAKKETLVAKKRERATLAIGLFKDSIRLDNVPTEAYFAWLTTLKEFWKEYYDDALQVYRLLDASSKKKNAYLVEKCELYLDNRLWIEAVDTCTASVETYPEKVESYARLAAALQVRGDIEKAKAVILKALRRNPGSFSVQKGAGDLYYQENNFVLAADHYTKALKIDPNAGAVYLNLALCQYQQKKYAEALTAFHTNCYMAKKIPKEFINAAGQLRDNFAVHSKYKHVLSSCKDLKPN